MERKMSWYAVRRVYHWGTKENGKKNVFEERTVCIEAADLDNAYDKGVIESKQYLDGADFSTHEEQTVFKQIGEPLIDGYEVWSELYESELSMQEFFEDRYKKYNYNRDSD